MTNEDNKTLISTEDYDKVNSDNFKDDLDSLLSHKIKEPKENSCGWAMTTLRYSRYGSIGHNGSRGYIRLIGNTLSEALLRVTADELILKDNSGELQAVFIDHDGYNVCDVKYIADSKAETLAHKLSQAPFDDIMDYIDNLETVTIK